MERRRGAQTSRHPVRGDGARRSAHGCRAAQAFLASFFVSFMQRYHSIEELPQTLPIFPLTGALLLPRGHLPLNIFEPRYLAMVDSALSTSRLIGMIQPTEAEDRVLKPKLSTVGCAGRIVSYRETEDGRFLITLMGVCRFR